MASIVINGDTSGSVTLQAPTAAGATVLTLPSTSGTVLTTASGQWITSGSNIYYNTGSVGIGTASPTQKLQVAGNISQTGSGYLAQTDGTNTVYFQLNPFSVANSFGIASGQSIPFIVGNSNTERMRIDSSGNVNIGTAGSGISYKLQVNQTFGNSFASSLGATAAGTANNQLAGISFNPTFANTVDYGPRRAADIWSGFNAANWGTQYLAFGVGNAANDAGNATPERMRIDSSGNVGIGTTSPTGNLDIASSSNVNVYIRQTTGVCNTRIKSDSTNAAIGTSTNHQFSLLQNNTEGLTIDTSQNLKFNSGYGSVATAYGCRAWVNFNGTGVVAIRASGNVTSITDNGVGSYTVNFTTAMPDVNYGIANGNGDISWGAVARFSSISTNNFLVETTGNSTTGNADCATVCVSIFR